jgi:hypothetical protein
MAETKICPWMERTSALLDGELPIEEIPLVERHLLSCEPCLAISRLGQQSEFYATSHELSSSRTVISGIQSSPVLRVVIGVLGALNLYLAIPNFIRGNADGDMLHDTRHLAIWQMTLGLATVVFAWSRSFSRFITASAITFLLLTLFSGVFDAITGHRGPWTDLTHLIEAVALLGILVAAYPRWRVVLDAKRHGSRRVA